MADYLDSAGYMSTAGNNYYVNITANTSNDLTWYQWNNEQPVVYATSATATTDASGTVWYRWVGHDEETQEQRAERERREAEYRANAERQRLEHERLAALRENERAEADARARKLLMDALTEPQLERFMRDECIPVDTAKGNKYLIKKARQINIDVLVPDDDKRHENWKVSHRLCAHPAHDVPDYDTMLTQLLYLRHAEDEFLQVAHRHPV